VETEIGNGCLSALSACAWAPSCEAMLILEGENLSKSFGGLMAVKNVSFTVDEGMIFGLIGPNGSGKTTLFNLITGFLKPNTGKIRFRGRDITGVAPYHICRVGIARTFQLNKPFCSMTVLENVMVGRIYGNESARSLRQAGAEAGELLRLTGLEKKQMVIAGALGIVDRKRLEVARALATKPKMLFLDEVMAGLNLREIEDVMQLLKNLRNSGLTLMVVEHVMKALLGISDHVMALSAGEKIAEGTPKEIVRNRQVIEAYLGEGYGA
jgi:branched-chain amino acid transport system ATP-binding protein